MSGNGGIIIKSRIAAVADSPAIKEKLAPRRLARHEAILAKNHAEWSDDDTHFVLRNIGHAHDAFQE